MDLSVLKPLLRTGFESLQNSIIDFVRTRTVTPVAENINLVAGGSKEYDLQTLIGTKAAQYDIEGCTVIVRVRDTDATSSTNNQYINAEGVAVWGIRDTRYVRVVNEFDAPLDFYVRIEVPKKPY